MYMWISIVWHYGMKVLFSSGCLYQLTIVSLSFVFLVNSYGIYFSANCLLERFFFDTTRCSVYQKKEIYCSLCGKLERGERVVEDWIRTMKKYVT